MSLSLVCVQLVFGIRFAICEPLVLWFVFGYVFVRESYLSVFGIWICESVSTQIFIIPNLL